jgi:arylsulfatase A-like enzyme
MQAELVSFELAQRMQHVAPDVLDLSSEPTSIRALYGLDEEPTDEFARQCLLARRLTEAGVRFVQINYGDESPNPRWDQHSDMPQHAKHARATDKPVAGLIRDLKARGLLEDTLVWWGGEFGRTPFAQGKDGRDHNPRGFTVWLAGGGVKAGHTHGATDELGHLAVQDPVHMHDLHATILHLLGLDHERLTHNWSGRDFRLTDVHGKVVHELFA